MTDDKIPREWAQLSRDEQLLSIYAELRRIADAVTDARDTATTEMYKCERCNATVPGNERADHARQEHKAPPEYADKLFTRVIE